MASEETDSSPESLLYHVKCEVIDYHKDLSGGTRTTEIFGTYTSLPVAKAAARSCLKAWGYDPSEFEIYAEDTDPEHWEYGDGVAAYAKAPAGQEFRVRLDTKPNVAELRGNETGALEGHLHYVLQTTIYYNKDRTGAMQATEVEGVYFTRKEAIDAAYTVLIDKDDGLTKEEYEEYDERDEQKDDWPFGEDVYVHAVHPSGENYLVEVKLQRGPYKH